MGVTLQSVVQFTEREDILLYLFKAFAARPLQKYRAAMLK